MEWEMTMRAGSIDYLKCHLGDYEALAASVYEYDVMTFPFYIFALMLYTCRLLMLYLSLLNIQFNIFNNDLAMTKVRAAVVL